MPKRLRLTLAAVFAFAAGCSAPPASECDPPRGVSVSWFELAASSGLVFHYEAPDDFKGGGLAVADLTGDGLADVVAARRGGGLAMFENLGGLQFKDVTVDVGLDASAAGSALAAVDLDGDGDREVVVAGDGSTRIFDNQGDGHFVEVAALTTGGPTEHVLAVDLDGDERLDLYLANYDIYDDVRTANHLFLNQGGLTFREQAAPGAGASWATSALDIDGDGDLDLYVANDTLAEDRGGPPPEMTRLHVDLLLRNDGIDAAGALQLTDIAAEAGLATPRSSMGGLVADFDRDERLDLYVPDYGPNKLFLRDGSSFVDAAATFGLGAGTRTSSRCTPPSYGCSLQSWSGVMADWNLDGFDDLLVTNGEVRTGDLPPVLLFVQTADDVWSERDPEIPCVDARAALASDLDDDGDLDLLIAPKDGPLALYENRASRGGGWLRVALEGAVNRDGIGARVIARFADGHVVTRAVGSGGVAHSSAPPEVHFGLGGVAIETIEVDWPSGRRVIVNDPPEGRILVVRETNAVWSARRR